DEPERRGVEGSRLQLAVCCREEHTTLPTGCRHEHRLRFRAEEWRAWHGRRPIEASDINAAPLIDAGPHEEEEVDAVRQEDGPSMRILAAVEVDQRGGLHGTAVRRHPGESLEDPVR